MAIKQVFDADHIQVNKFLLLIVGLPPITFTSVGAIETELDDVELPDRTRGTGGRQKAGEVEVVQPAHQKLGAERAAMELWFSLCQDNVSPLHKRTGVLTAFTQSNKPLFSYRLEGLKIMKRALPEFSLDNDGEMAQVTWTLTYDKVTKVI